MSAIEELKERIEILETEVAKLKENRTNAGAQSTGHAWLDKIYGSFANDPEYLDAMRLGRKFRGSIKRKSGKSPKRKPSHVDS